MPTIQAGPRWLMDIQPASCARIYYFEVSNSRMEGTLSCSGMRRFPLKTFGMLSLALWQRAPNRALVARTTPHPRPLGGSGAIWGPTGRCQRQWHRLLAKHTVHRDQLENDAVYRAQEGSCQHQRHNVSLEPHSLPTKLKRQSKRTDDNP